MTYTKPEVNSLGHAVRIIQGCKCGMGGLDPFDLKFDLKPAYDLDE